MKAEPVKRESERLNAFKIRLNNTKGILRSNPFVDRFR
jgi:hypothetical protein